MSRRAVQKLRMSSRRPHSPVPARDDHSFALPAGIVLFNL